jgi:hypothetical protein
MPKPLKRRSLTGKLVAAPSEFFIPSFGSTPTVSSKRAAASSKRTAGSSKASATSFTNNTSNTTKTRRKVNTELNQPKKVVTRRKKNINALHSVIEPEPVADTKKNRRRSKKE